MDVKTWEIKFKDEPDFLSFTAIPDDRGRITIPASIRKKLRISFCSKILTRVKSIRVTDGGEKDERR